MIERESLDHLNKDAQPVQISSDQEMLNPMEPLFDDINLQAVEAVFAPRDDIFELSDRIKGISSKGRSQEFCNLQYAIVKNEAVISGIASGKIDFAGETYQQFMSIYQAISSYMTVHVNTSDKKSIDVYKTAESLRKMLDDAAKSQLGDIEITGIAGAHGSSQEKEYAAENIERLLKYYRKYSMRVDQDLLATDEEKLIRKWDALKGSERDIELYLADKIKNAARRRIRLNAEDAFLYQEYRSLKTQIMFRNLIQGDRIEKHTNKDEGLDAKQIAAISRVDTWIIRNFRNGGYMAVFGDVCDRTDIIGRLMAMSRRKRLYIYYLIESRQRLKPTAEGLIRSQLSYIPSLDNFKDKMIASKFKFYKRFSGGYIYWEKLTEAMGIAAKAQPMFSKMDLLLSEKEKKDAENKNNNNIIPEGEERERLKDILRLSLKAIRLAEENNNKKTGKDKIAENENEIKGIREQITKILEQNKAEGISMKADVKTYTQKMPSDMVSVARIVKAALSEPDVLKYYNYALNGTSLFSSIAGMAFTLLSLTKDSKSMNWLDFTSTGVGLANSVYKSASTTASVASAAGANGAVTKVLTSKASIITTAGVDTAVAVMNSASYWKGSKNRIKASKLAGKLGRKGLKENSEDKFREGMLELNRRLGKRQKKNTLGSLGTASLSSTVSILTALSVVTAGTAAIAGAIAFGIGTGLSVYDARAGRKMKNVLFDSFYETDKVFATEEAKWKEKNPGRQLTEAQKRLMKELIRNRIAASEGFYSPRHAARAVAAEYAKFLLEGANAFTDEAPMYIAMIKGLGLPFRFDPLNEKGNVPKASDIVKKLCG